MTPILVGRNQVMAVPRRTVSDNELVVKMRRADPEMADLLERSYHTMPPPTPGV